MIFFLGLALTQVLSFSATVYERDEALRRVLSNLIDNALKFSNQSELLVETLQNGQIHCCAGPRARHTRA
jgi:signal transduction histidine kinase